MKECEMEERKVRVAIVLIYDGLKKQAVLSLKITGAYGTNSYTLVNELDKKWWSQSQSFLLA